MPDDVRREGSILTVATRSKRTALEVVDLNGPAEREVIDYVRQRWRAGRVDGGLFERLSARLGVPGLLELTCLAGHDGVVAGIVDAVEVAPAPDAELLALA